MLSDEVLERITNAIAKRMEEGNEYIIKQIAKTIKQIGEMTPTQASQMVQIFKYGGDYEKMVRKLSQLTKLTQKDIRKVFEAEAKKDLKFSKQFYEYRNKKYIPWEENIALQNQVKAMANIVAKEIQGITNKDVLGLGVVDKEGEIVYKKLKKAYYDIIDRCVLSISQGKDTYSSLMYKQIKELGENGLKVIYPTTYIDKDGIVRHHTRRLDSALRMNIMDSIRALHNETQEELGKQFGSDGVEITVHSNPAPDHAEVQGRQFKKEEYEKFQNHETAKTYTGQVIDPIHKGRVRRQISQYNCYHNARHIILGINKPQFSEKELQEIQKDNERGFEYKGRHYTMYEGTQLQRRIETEIRKQKEFQMSAVESGNEQGIIKAQTKITKLNKEYRAISEASGLSEKRNRTRVPGYKRTSVN